MCNEMHKNRSAVFHHKHVLRIIRIRTASLANRLLNDVCMMQLDNILHEEKKGSVNPREGKKKQNKSNPTNRIHRDRLGQSAREQNTKRNDSNSTTFTRQVLSDPFDKSSQLKCLLRTECVRVCVYLRATAPDIYSMCECEWWQQ